MRSWVGLVVAASAAWGESDAVSKLQQGNAALSLARNDVHALTELADKHWDPGVAGTLIAAADHELRDAATQLGQLVHVKARRTSAQMDITRAETSLARVQCVLKELAPADAEDGQPQAEPRKAIGAEQARKGLLEAQRELVEASRDFQRVARDFGQPAE